MLRALATALPAGASVPVPREWLLELLGPAKASPAAEVADSTVDDLARRYSRAASTVRGWIEAGQFPGAYRLRGREWRVPLSGLTAFEDHERQHVREQSAPPTPEGAAGLVDWLKRTRKAG